MIYPASFPVDASLDAGSKNLISYILAAAPNRVNPGCVKTHVSETVLGGMGGYDLPLPVDDLLDPIPCFLSL